MTRPGYRPSSGKVKRNDNARISFCPKGNKCDCDTIPDEIFYGLYWSVNGLDTCTVHSDRSYTGGTGDCSLVKPIKEICHWTGNCGVDTPELHMACSELAPDPSAPVFEECSPTLGCDHLWFKAGALNDGNPWVPVSRCTFENDPKCCFIWDYGDLPELDKVLSNFPGQCGIAVAQAMFIFEYEIESSDYGCDCCDDCFSFGFYFNDDVTPCDVDLFSCSSSGSILPTFPQEGICVAAGGTCQSTCNSSLWEIDWTIECPDFYTNAGDIVLKVRWREEEGPDVTITHTVESFVCDHTFSNTNSYIEFSQETAPAPCSCIYQPTMWHPLGGPPLFAALGEPESEIDDHF